MALDGTVIDSAIEKRYTDFSKSIKAELHRKLASHETVKNYVTDFDKIQNMKSSFANIGSAEEQSYETDV